jgi:cytochrome c oxidase assembly factor CtaG
MEADINDDLLNEYLIVRKWIIEAERYKRIKAMAYKYKIPEHIKEMCKQLRIKSEQLKHKS